MTDTIATPTTYMAIHHRGAGDFVPEQEQMPKVGHGESLIAVEAAGLCGTDLHITSPNATYPCDTEVMGHEICGRVVSGPEHLVGRRVVVDPTVTCGTCEPCRRGFFTQCVDFGSIGIQRPGGFAEYALVPTDRLLPIAEHVEPAAATVAEPLSCVLYALSRLPTLEASGRAVVLGGGPIGVLFAAVLERAFAREVIVVEPSERRAAHIRSRLAAQVVRPGGVREDFAPELVVDATGFLFSEAVRITRPGGVILCFGLQDKGGVSDQIQFTLKELTAIAARAANGTFGKAVELLEKGVIQGDDVITATYPLAEIRAGFDEARSAHGLKVVLLPG